MHKLRGLTMNSGFNFTFMLSFTVILTQLYMSTNLKIPFFLKITRKEELNDQYQTFGFDLVTFPQKDISWI